MEQQNPDMSKLEMAKEIMIDLFVNKYGGCNCNFPPKFLKFYGRDKRGKPRFTGEWSCSKCSKVLNADTLIDFEMELNGLIEKSKEVIQNINEEKREEQIRPELPDSNTINFNINK